MRDLMLTTPVVKRTYADDDPPPAIVSKWYDPPEKKRRKEKLRQAVAACAEAEPEDQEALDANIHRVALMPRATDAELADGDVPKRGFLPSDGVGISDDALTARHELDGRRQAILSRDWVHVDHAVKRRSWTVRAKVAHWPRADIYIGLTQASGFHHLGAWTMGFDVSGRYLGGSAPLDLYNMHSKKCFDQAANRGSWVRVTADLETQKMVWELLDGEKWDSEVLHTLEESMPRMQFWRSARLWVTARTEGDIVEMRP
jgi:hypothetical protein